MFEGTDGNIYFHEADEQVQQDGHGIKMFDMLAMAISAVAIDTVTEFEAGSDTFVTKHLSKLKEQIYNVQDLEDRLNDFRLLMLNTGHNSDLMEVRQKGMEIIKREKKS